MLHVPQLIHLTLTYFYLTVTDRVSHMKPWVLHDP